MTFWLFSFQFLQYFQGAPSNNLLQPTLKGSRMKKELRRDRHTVSLLTDHMVFSPKYRGKVLVGDVAMVAEAIIRKTCKELDIEVIDMAVNPDHVHIFIGTVP